MADEKNDQRVDRLLDELLSQYSALEPRPGLETKVLAQLSESARDRTRWWMWAWLAAGATTAIAATIILLAFTATRKGPQSPTIAMAPPSHARELHAPKAIEPSSIRVAATRPQMRRRQHVSAENVTVARKEVFPTPEPMSQQDMLLLRYLAATPHEELVAESRPDPPPLERAP